MSRNRVTNRNRGIALGALAALIFCAVIGSIHATADSSAKGKSLVILYTSQTNGQIRSCNCTKFRYGGYGRECTLVDKIRKSNENVVVIEGGDMFGRLDSAQDKLKADVTIKAMNAIGYSAIVPGESEVRLNKELLQKYQADSTVPFVLANVRYKDSDKPICAKPYVIVKTEGGINVGVIGLLGSDAASKLPDAASNTEIADPSTTLKSILPEVRKKSDFVVVAAHMDPAQAKELGKQAGVDLTLCTHSGRPIEMPEKDQNVVRHTVEKVGESAYIDSGSSKGWCVGRIDVRWNDDKPSVESHEMIFLDRAYDEDPRLVEIYDGYNAAVREMTLSQELTLKNDLIERMKKRGIDVSKLQRESPFAGHERCGKCHKEAHKIWEKSRHATAFASLEKTNQDYDPECVGCHTTGMMAQGGFTNAKDTPNLKEVQCESCHGAGLSHANKPGKGYGAVEEVACRSCHTDDYNPDFDYDKMWSVVKH